MAKLVLFKFILIVLTTSTALNAKAHRTDEPLYLKKSWPGFVECLYYYQKKNPGLYPPVELVRLDLVNSIELDKILHKYIGLWSQAKKYPHQIKRVAMMNKVSKSANYDYYRLIKISEKNLGWKINGSHKKWLDSIDESLRQALSPLDDKFKISELGKKVYDKANKEKGIEWIATSFSNKDKRIVLDGFDSNNQRIIFDMKAKKSNLNASEYVFRGKYKPAILMDLSDLKINPSLMRGNFLNPENKKEVFGFGKYVSSSEVFLDDSGHQHFAGDGHNH